MNKKEFNLESMKKMMGLEVTSKSLKDNFDDILKAMVDLPSRGLKIIVKFKDLSDEEFKQVIDCIKKYNDDADYTIVGVMDIDYKDMTSGTKGKSEFIYMYTENYITPVILVDSLNKTLYIQKEELFISDLDEIKKDITQTDLVSENIVTCIKEPVREILGEDHPILKKVERYSNVEIEGQINQSWNPCETTAVRCRDLDLYYGMKPNKEDVIFDDMTYYMSIFGNLDIISVYQSEKGIRQVADTLKYCLMKLSSDESLPISSVLRDHNLLRELKRRTIKDLISEWISKNKLIEENGLPSSEEGYTIGDFINEYNRHFNLCLTVLYLDLNIEPNVNGFKNSERVLAIFNMCKEMYLDFIKRLYDMDIDVLLKDGGFALLYHYTRQKVSMSKYMVAKSMHADISELLEKMKSAEDSEKIESGEIKLN